MAGPTPHRLHSFGELRTINGRAWLVCRPCRRYAVVPAGALKDRDTRETTFSCSVCGAPGTLVLEDPHKEGLQPDTRRGARHHPHAIVRLRAFAAMSGRHKQKLPREALPQASPRPKPQPDPRYTLKPFPCQSFGDLATWGLKANVWCSGCHRHQPLGVGDNLQALPLFRTRLRCTGTVAASVVVPGGLPCGGRGRLSVIPANLGGSVPRELFVSVNCYNPEHTGFDAAYLVLSRPPWQDFLAKGESFGCPGCGCRMQHVWHGAGSRTR